MKKFLFLFAASCMLLSCGGGLDVKEIEFDPSSDIQDASAVKVVNISAPALVETDAVYGYMTSSAEIEIVNDLGEVNVLCGLSLLDKNGSIITTLDPSSEVLFKTPGKKSITFYRRYIDGEKIHQYTIKSYIEQIEAGQILMSLKTKGKDPLVQVKELTSQIFNLLKENKLDEANDLLRNAGFAENFNCHETKEQYDPIYYKVIKANVDNGDFDTAEEFAIFLKSATDVLWDDTSVYKYLKSQYEKNGRDFSVLKRY